MELENTFLFESWIYGIWLGKEARMNEQINKNDVFLKGKHVILKALTEEDVSNSNWYGWFNDEETTQHMQQHYFPNTREAQLEFYRKEIVGNSRKLQLGICDVKGGPIVGVTSLNNIDHLSQKAQFSLIIGEVAYRKAHYVIEVFQLILFHAFNTLNLQRVYGGSLNNESIEFICRTLGATREGVLRKDVYKNGRYHDVYLYAILREEYDRITALRHQNAQPCEGGHHAE